MSIKLKISADELSNSFIVNDCTGNYAHDNTGGYGPPVNYQIKDIKEAYLEFKFPSDTEYSHKVITTPDFPNKDGFGIEILPYMVGLADIESGQCKIKFTVVFNTKTGSTETFSAYTTIVFVKNIECCIDKLTANRLNTGAFKDEQQKLILELSNLLEGVKYQIEDGLYDTADKTIDYLKSHCKCCGCN